MTKIYSILFFFISLFSIAQKSSFSNEELAKALVTELNKFRIQNGLDTFEVNSILVKAATFSATNMSKSEQVKIDPKQTQKNLVKAGGTKKGEEVAMNAPYSKGRDNYSIADVAKVIWTRWENNKKDKPVILNPQYVMIGISCALDKDGKKAYASAVLGGYGSFNEGAKKKKELAVPFNKKSKKLGTPEQKACKNCDKWKNYDALQKGLIVEKDKIYLTYNNLKELKRLLKKSKDGLAVDIVQKAQYEKADYNIMDNNLQNKGVMQKVIYKDKLFSKNLIKPDPKAKKKQKINSLKVEMGKFNPKIKGPYELNLIVVQDGHVCRTVLRGYIENGDQESSTPLELLPANQSTGLKPPFEPKSETSVLTFNIPFAKNKSEFKPEDIQPFINALNEPDFIINNLNITAFSSIEGDSISNAKLQRKRAESVVKVLQNMQKGKIIKPTIETKDSWNLFVLEMEDGKYADLVNMGKKKAVQKINTNGSLLEELEPTLAKQRFAKIVMDVIYDISGNKEQKFSTASFNKMIKTGNFNQAYKIMEYIHKKVTAKQYTSDAWDSLKLPNDAKYANFMMNKVYFDYLANNKVVDEDHYTELKKIVKLDPNNEVLRYNKLFCAIKVDSTIGTKDDQAKLQQEIDGLYKTSLSKKLIDGLNIEWQFKLIDALDTTDGAEAQIDACIEKIKGFYNFKEASWQNALKLSYVFTRAKDYKFACGLLEPYLKDKQVDQNLVFTYLSIASHLPEKFYSRTFSDALHTAKEKNRDRYCQLFGDPYMSFQVLDNPNIKKEYNSAKCSK